MSQILEYFKREVERRSKPIDTTQLQLESLYRFAAKLGYLPIKIVMPCANQGFVNSNISLKWRYVSFNKMVSWHNKGISYFYNLKPVSSEVETNANLAKLVENLSCNILRVVLFHITMMSTTSM